MLSAFFGLIAAALGLWGLIIWHSEFLFFMRGMVPVSMFCAGVLAIVIGLSSRQRKPNPLLNKKEHGKN